MQDMDHMKVKFTPHWDDYFKEKKTEILIPAHFGKDSIDSPHSSISPKARRQKSWKLPLVYSVCLLLMVNCSAMVFRGSPPSSLPKLMRNIGIYLPMPAPPTVPSVAFALERATVKEASLLIPGEDIPENVLRSSLSNWICSRDGSAWTQKARNTRRSEMERNNKSRRRSAKEAGSSARLCEADWGVELPVIRNVAYVGYNPATAPPLSQLGSKPGVTLVMPVSVSQLHMLENQCTLWAGLPLAAAVYIPLYQGKPLDFPGLDSAVAEVLSLAKQLDGAGPENACKLSLDIVVEDLCSESIGEPVNALRNRALRMVETEAVFLSDGLHLVGTSLRAVFNSTARTKAVLAAAKANAGVAVPALSLTNPWHGKVRRQLAVEYAQTDFRGGLLKMVRSKQLEGPLGWGLNTTAMHRAFNKWSSARNSLNKTEMGDGASPLAVMLTKRVPWFDERARGSSWAQALHVKHSEALAKSNVWTILGGVWAVRVAPDEEEMQRQGGETQARANRALFNVHSGAIETEEYLPAVGLQELCYT